MKSNPLPSYTNPNETKQIQQHYDSYSTESYQNPNQQQTQTTKIKITNPQKSKKMGDSRTKKALSTALLVYFGLKENMTIQFSKSRKSFYALKVLRGNAIVSQGKQYEMDDFVKIDKYKAKVKKNK